MYINRLNLENFRAFRDAKFDFWPLDGQLNSLYLLVGVNGVGKSSALDALRFALSHIFPLISSPYGGRQRLKPEDFTVGTNHLSIEVEFEAGGVDFRFVYKAELHGESVRSVTSDLTPTMEQVRGIYGKGPLPLAVYFSPLRSVLDPENFDPPKRPLQTVAYHRALLPRALRVAEVFHWLKGIEQFASDGLAPYPQQYATLQEAVKRLLPGCQNLRVVPDKKPRLHIQKGADELDVAQLSDGERSVLALVLEVARRLAQANPKAQDPLNEAQAIILIDELDLHLHPGWQRDIVERLKTTFRRCQIIASTHSPQTIGEVEGQHITLIYTDGETEHPSQSYGMEAGWIIEVLMESKDQNRVVKALETQIFSEIQQRQFEPAEESLKRLRHLINGPSEAEREATNLLERVQKI